MFLKKKATVLISTVIILSLMSILGCFLYSTMKHNNELGSYYKFDMDKYDFCNREEETLYKFMKELNKERKDKLSNSDESNSDDQDLFAEDFEKKIDEDTLKYNKNDSKLLLITQNDNGGIRKREILYYIKEDEKIVLIPTYKFENSDE